MSLDRGAMGRLSVQRLSKRFTRNREYDRVDDTTDTRVPLYNEDAFQHGLAFKAKYIGTSEISKPSSKLDIITAMRKIRYDYKAKGVKKIRCLIDVSTNGVRITKRKRRRRKQYNEEQLFMMQHAIYRIFYVSHDSQDLKIFSYITREVPSNTFRCNVFKAYKKRMALHVVRSLGQAFDVCHKLNPRPKKKKQVQQDETKLEQKQEEEKLEEMKEPLPRMDNLPLGQLANTAQDPINSDPFSPGGGLTDIPPLIDLDPLAPFNLPTLPPNDVEQPFPLITYVGRPRPRPGQNVIQENPMMVGSSDSLKGNLSPAVSLGEPLNDTDGTWTQEKQQMRSQLTLLNEKLNSETSTRIESQARVEHLLMQNKELLSHLQKLMVQLQQLQSLQMSQIISSAKTPQSSKGPTPTDLTPPNTDQSEPSSSEVHLRNELESSPEEVVPLKANISEELPLLENIVGPIALDTTSEESIPHDQKSHDTASQDSNDDQVQLVSHDQANISAAFTPPDESHDQATLDAAFTPTTVTVAS